MTRFEFLTEMIQTHDFKIGVEIGTGLGKTAMELLKNNPELHLVEVAYYSDKSFHKGDFTYRAKRTWLRRIRKYMHRVTVLPYPSREAVKRIEDESLDFIFIDADHSYKECLWDILNWMPKVRSGGLVCGHDFQDRFPGVEKAVRKVFGTEFKITPEDFVWYVWKK